MAVVVPALSVVAPAHDEAPNLPGLVEGVEKALTPLGIDYELVIVDDGSEDETADLLASLQRGKPWLRAVRLRGAAPGRPLGQSAALHAGIRAARAPLVATLDADLQNDPADIPRLLALLQHEHLDLVQGDRSASRADGWMRQRSSAVGRLTRRLLLGDPVRDTGCTLRVMRRELALTLPLELAGLHRFVPAVARQLGARIAELPVAHRTRHAGSSRYGSGLGRALPGLVDTFGVRWLGRRRRAVDWDERPQ